MRALEAELSRTFPAIKKQIDSMHEAEVIDINKEGQGWSITVKPDFHEKIKDIFFFCLKQDLINLFKTYEVMIDKYFFGKKFGVDLEMDLVIIYKNCDKVITDQIKEEINNIFRNYFIELVSVVFMPSDEREKRYRLADRFVLQIIRSLPTPK
ncbi:hypothetical protein KKG31_07025 [Patescibacteria group bacterium]|nr:hypothetical protein [Patescibacteria group bacterium]MBU1758836.1 hypothetical protein [Patescibacteria group bacterium]